jgi:hypothetical protein
MKTNVFWEHTRIAKDLHLLVGIEKCKSKMNLEKGWVPIQTSKLLPIVHIWQVHGRRQNNNHDYSLHIATFSFTFH